MQLRTAAMIGGTAAAMATAGTVAYRRPGRQSRGEAIVRDLGYAPSLVGAAAIPVGLALTVLPRTRSIGVTTAAAGAALLGGQALGTAATGALMGSRTIGTTHATLPQPNATLAREGAEETLAKIPASARQVVLWAPGTLRSQIPAEFADAVRSRFDSGTALVKLPTPSGYDERQAVADGAETLRQVIDALSSWPGGGPQIYLSGESNGAWVVTELLADPTYRPKIQRAVTWGMPAAAAHRFPTGTDPDVFEIRDEYDMVPRPVVGDQDALLDSIEGVFSGRIREVIHLPGFLLNNPWETSLLARTGIRRVLPGGYDRDPHNYREHMPNAAALLHG